MILFFWIVIFAAIVPAIIGTVGALIKKKREGRKWRY